MKDPAFLFYTSDFLTGTMFMSDEQVGQYIKLLCAQHQKGRLSEKHMLSVCKTYDEEVYSKFTIDSKGFFYNKRLEEETLRRSKFTESRRNNAKGKRKITLKPKKAYARHMETETVTETVIKNEIILPFAEPEFLEVWNGWKQFKKEQFRFTYKPIGERGALKDIYDLSNGNMEMACAIILQSIKKGWKGLFELKTNNNGKQTSEITETDVDNYLDKKYGTGD